MNRKTPGFIPLILLVILATIGCEEDENAQVAKVAIEAAKQQAELNQEMSRLNREVASGTKRLVEANAESQEKLVVLQSDLQGEQAEVSRQRDNLEVERKDIAAQRIRESVLAPVVAWILPFAICGLALATCCFLLFGLRRATDDEAAISELLVEELTSERPTLLPGPATQVAIEDHAHTADGESGSAGQP
jgi:hypothetical protein